MDLILNLNFLFMSIVASILGTISLETINATINETTQMPYLWVDGCISLFIFFAGELSKDLLQQEKLTKRLEWKLANGIRIHSVLLENTLVLWLGTMLLLSPLCVIMLLGHRVSIFSLATGGYFAVLSLLYAAFTNLAILWLKNMNRFRSIPVFVTAGHILLMAARHWLYSITDSKALFFLFPLLVLSLLTTSGLFGLTKERIVSSYY